MKNKAKQGAAANEVKSAAKKKGSKKKVQSFYEITPALLKKVEKLAAKGLYLTEIADQLGWSEATIHKYKSSNVELAEAIKRGQQKDIRETVNALTKRVKGYSYTEVTKERAKNGRLVVTKEVKKRVPPSDTAIIFKLVNKDPDNYKHKSEQVVSGDVEFQVGNVTKKDIKKVKELFDGVTE